MLNTESSDVLITVIFGYIIEANPPSTTPAGDISTFSILYVPEEESNFPCVIELPQVNLDKSPPVPLPSLACPPANNCPALFTSQS